MALCTSIPLPSSTPATFVSAVLCNSLTWSIAPRKVSKKPHSFPPVLLTASPVAGAAMRTLEIGSAISISSSLAQNVQGLLDHVFARLHCGGIQLIGTHRSHQIGHLFHWVNRWIVDIPLGIGIRMPRLKSLQRRCRI